MRLFGTAYSPGSEAKLSTHVRGFATRTHTASNVDLRDEPLSPRHQTNTIPQIVYTRPLNSTPVENRFFARNSQASMARYTGSHRADAGHA